MTDEQDALEIATRELAEGMVIPPDDLLDDIGPLGCLWYLTQCATFTLGRWAGTIDSDAGAELQDGDAPIQALEAITKATGILTGACALVSILPEDAGDIPNGSEPA